MIVPPKLLKKALEKWGYHDQELKLAEECNELSRAIIRGQMNLFDQAEDNFFEELIDVKIMIAQMEWFYTVKAHEDLKAQFFSMYLLKISELRERLEQEKSS